MSGQATGAAFGAGKVWLMTIVVAVAVGGSPMGQDWANYSGHVVFNAAGAAATALKSSGGWFKEGQGAPAPAAAPAAPATPGAPAVAAPLVPVKAG